MAERTYTLLLEVTITMPSHKAALEEGQKMLDYLVSGWDGAAGAVVGMMQQEIERI
jgi:hypothetical protein